MYASIDVGTFSNHYEESESHIQFNFERQKFIRRVLFKTDRIKSNGSFQCTPGILSREISGSMWTMILTG